MTPAAAAWERTAEIRGAADGWRRAGAIDDATATRIREAFPDPCETPPAAWRALTAAVTSAIVLCLLGAFALALSRSETARQALLFVFAGAAAAVTERLEASPRMARRGIAGATAFWSVALLLAGVALVLSDHLRLDDALDWFLAAAALASGLACWRWGSPLFAALSAVALFALLARLPPGRVLWLVSGVALAALAARRLDHAAWAPSHRRAAAVLVVAAIAAVYAAVNVYSLEQHLIEGIRRTGAPDGRPPSSLLLLSALATLAVPLAVLSWGLRARRTWLIDAGIALSALSLIALRHYVHVAPLWVVLMAAGAALVGLAIALERRLRRGPGGEIGGFTADPLFSDERRAIALEVVPVVTTLTPAGHGPAARDQGVAGRGGAFGGGGATEKF